MLIDGSDEDRQAAAVWFVREHMHSDIAKSSAELKRLLPVWIKVREMIKSGEPVQQDVIMACAIMLDKEGRTTTTQVC